ncbi:MULTISPECIES: Rne/Rng family ribonuclease [Falsihalocynthiibacter]|uniref:Rne/Rng family ribonuclease n=1 Tax=Falsihalocynthiibacter TaxID=2854182 RepID=UPI00300110BC
MAKKMLIDATHAEETRVVVVDGTKVEEFDFEAENRRQLAGNIYLAKVTRVEPSLQAAFIDYGGNRHGFLAFSEIHPDYYQIPIADREALLAEEAAYAKSLQDDDEQPDPKRRRRRRSGKAAEAKSGDAVETKEITEDTPKKESDGPSSMDVVDFGEDDDSQNADAFEGSSPMELVAETPVDTPAADEPEDEDTSPAVKTDASDEDDSDDGDDDDAPLQATDKDDSIESVADEDVQDEVRAPRKFRPRKYKIQEVIKVRQILLVQVVKEERGNKGAALTTYLSLAGRYCVLMPNTARGGGISRKITNIADRKKLKQIAQEIDVPEGAGLIVRTAGAERTKPEIKRDYEYLQRLWEQIRSLTLKSIAPAKIYEEGDLVKRTIRDLYNSEIDEVLVEGEAGYRVAKDFMKMIMPSHAKNVKRYTDPLPLFARFQVETYLAGMFNPTVQLKSGGYIVIDVTEALVAVDVNSGRATKEGSIEDTATKTNLEAAEEVARQVRLRDLAGLIVIDFIDMEDRRNNAAVEKRMKDKLKTDRARIQVGRISGFGLMEMSRQRLRPGMLEATTQPCHHCHGTGLIRSDDNLALAILRQLEEEGVRRRAREVLLKAPVGIMNFLVNNKREHIAQIEARYGLSVRIEADPFLVSPDFSIERFKTATRNLRPVETAVVSADASLMDDLDEEIEALEVEEEVVVAPVVAEAPSDGPSLNEDGTPKKRRRRRRRRRGGNGGDASNSEGNNRAPQDASSDGENTAPTVDATSGADSEAPSVNSQEQVAEVSEEASGKRRRAPRRKKSDAVAEGTNETAVGDVAASETSPEVEPGGSQSDSIDNTVKKPVRKRAPRKKPVVEALADANHAEESSDNVAPVTEPPSETVQEVEKPKTPRKRAPRKPKVAAGEESTAEVAEVTSAPKPPRKRAKAVPKAKKDTIVEVVSEPVVEATSESAVLAENVPAKPKKLGWWSAGK